MGSPPSNDPTQENPQPQVPPVVQIDPKCLHSVLKEFAEPLRTNDSRTDFFATYRRESAEFDRDYAKKYDEDLNTSLIFAGLFSAVSSAFVVDVQSKLEPDPNETTAAYMRILIHTMNNSLFPDAEPSSVAWTGPPPGIVTVQSLLYASLTTSLFAAFLAMLGKQWVNLYLRNHGGSAADKSRDRQRKLDGFEKWYFHLIIESLPVMLQLALLLLGCALSKYLWMTSHTVAGVIAGVTLFGVTLYVFLTLAATFYDACPYQTPPSILARTLINYVSHGDDAFANSLRSLTAPFPSIEDLRRSLWHLRAGVRRVRESSGCISGEPEEIGHIPLTVVTSPSPARIFEGYSIDWEVCKAESRCISWILSSTTDIDVIYSAVRFTADTIWYPEIAGTLSPHVLADLFLDCLLDGQVVPGKEEHASSIGMALASVLSTHLTMEPENRALKDLCEHIGKNVRPLFSSKPMYKLVVTTLEFIRDATHMDLHHLHSWNKTSNLSVAQKLWLSRIALQTLWRRKRLVGSPFEPGDAISLICNSSTADGGQTPTIIKTNCFLTMAISLGLRIDIRDLYAPNNNDALDTAILLFHQQLRRSIGEGKVDSYHLTACLSALSGFDLFRTTKHVGYGFLWIADLLSSGYIELGRYSMASEVIQLVADNIIRMPREFDPSWVSSLVSFLSLGEWLYSKGSIPHPGPLALRILSESSTSDDFDFTPTILPVLASTLIPIHPLKSRILALEVFLKVGQSSSRMENVPTKHLDELLQVVGDPFEYLDPPLQYGQPVVGADYDPMGAAVALIRLASSDLWANHLRHSNFVSCEEVFSTATGRWTALKEMLLAAPELFRTHAGIIGAVRRLEELQCPNTAEVVILWAWTAGVVDVVGHDTWGSIERETLNFYQTHGNRRLTTLSRHIIDDTMISHRLMLGFHHLLRGKARQQRNLQPSEVLRIAQACHLKSLCQLFGYGPTTWKEAFTVEEVDENTDVLSGRSVTPPRFTDWACDYP